MANIRTQVSGSTRRVVTKIVNGQRRVSCSCCEEGLSCCVYPASCGKGPESVLHYGSVISGDGTTFGNTTNGVILEGSKWAVYRDGVRTTQDCLRMAYEVDLPPGQNAIINVVPSSVAANLASSYVLELSYEPSGSISTTLTFNGVITAAEGDPDIFFEVDGQCAWSGSSGSPDYDEGFGLVFNPASCRWLLATGPLNYFIGYLDSNLPIGNYTIFNPQNEEYAIIS